jgi:hypothetical protein
MTEGAFTKPDSFLMLSGREFAAGAALWNDGRLEIGHYVHIAGKDFEDAEKDLKAHLGKGIVAAQATMPLAVCDLSKAASADEAAATLAARLGIPAMDVAAAFFDRTSALLLKPGSGLKNAVAVGFSRREIARYRADIARLGVPKAALTIRMLNALGSLREALKKGTAEGPVLCASMLESSTQLFLASADSIEEIPGLDIGYTGLLSQIMSALNLKFEGSAARLFFGNLYDFDSLADALAAPLTGRIEAKLRDLHHDKPKSLMISGLPPARARLLSRHIAPRLGMEPLCLPILVTASEGGLPVLPAIGAPSLVHMFLSVTGNSVCAKSFYLDVNHEALDLAAFWKAAPPEHHIIHMYRGIAFDETGAVVEPAHAAKPAKAPGGNQENHRILRYYRGTPVYADEADAAVPVPQSAPSPTMPAIPAEAAVPKPETPPRRILRMYRGTPVYADE